MRKLFLLFLFSTTTFFLRAERIKKIVVTNNSPYHITYGTVVEFSFDYFTKKGKQKKFVYKDIEKYFTLSGVNGHWEVNEYDKDFKLEIKFTIERFPQSFNLDSAQAFLHFDNQHGVIIDQKFSFKVDKDCALELDFSGSRGESGTSGKSGSYPLIGRDGDGGYSGSNGKNGGNGKNLIVKIKKEKDSSGIFFTYLTVIDTAEKKIYYYKTPFPDQGIIINVSGGNGGGGGTGGDGSNGKDGKETEKKIKDPGNGGPGGSGGNGGNGGNGGTVSFVLPLGTPGLEDYFQVISNGGSGGAGGDPGAGGKGGDAVVEGQTPGSGGSYGEDGQNGTDGLPGFWEIKMENF
jgi:hypothetical protein